jgi:hydroxymethylglutaryl-CoA synthase
MCGILSLGVYIPRNRLVRGDLGSFWGSKVPKGEKAVASYDQDCITLAVEAARNCLAGVDVCGIDALFLATASSPFAEKQASSLIATVLSVPEQALTADFGSSTRAGTIALQAAMNMVKAKAARNVLVIAGDCRLSCPGSSAEMYFGDGAVALLVGEENVIAKIKDSRTHYDEMYDIWRLGKDRFVQTWEDRWVNTQGYERNMRKAITDLMKRNNVSPNEFAKIAAYGPYPRSHSNLMQSLGFDLESQVAGPLLDMVGNTGTACAFISLACALEEAKPHERILFANYGSGADAFIVEKTDKTAGEGATGRKIRDYVDLKRVISYSQYLRFNQLVEMEVGGDRPPTMTSPVVLWRDRRTTLSLVGSKCRKCGKIQYPIQRVCMLCRTKDDFDEFDFAHKKGTLFTFSLDVIAPSPERPSIRAVVDFEGEGRLKCFLVDCEPQEARIGMPVEMSFRKIHEAKGWPHYWWKAVPTRN